MVTETSKHLKNPIFYEFKHSFNYSILQCRLHHLIGKFWSYPRNWLRLHHLRP